LCELITTDVITIH